MIKIIIAVLLLCGAVFLGPRLADSQGFVHIATECYIIETSLTTAIILAIVSFVVLHIVVNLINRSIRLPKLTARWFVNRKAKKLQILQNEAFLAFDEGAYNRALGLLKKIGPRASLPVPFLLLGAKCAFAQGDLDSCRQFLDQAESSKDTSNVACKLLRAKLNLKIGNAEAALENISSLGLDSHDASVVKMLYNCYLSEKQFDKIKELLPTLVKLKMVDDDEASLIAQGYAQDAVQECKDEVAVDTVINSLSKSERNNAMVMAPVVTRLVALGAVDKASKLTVGLLRRSDNHQEVLLNAIATWSVAAPEVFKELSEQESNNAIGSQTNVPLLKALANLELKDGKLSEAKTHLSKALTMDKSTDLYVLAAELNERLSHFDEAAKFFALALKNKADAQLPALS